MRPARPEPSIVGIHDTLSNFSGDPEWNLGKATLLINKHFPSQVWTQDFPPFSAFERCLLTPKEKESGPDRVPPYLLHRLPEEGKLILYKALQPIWEGHPIPVSWTRSRVTLIYKKKDPNLLTNYRPITVSTSMYRVLTKLMLLTIQPNLENLLSEEQYGGRKGRTATLQACNLMSRLQDGRSCWMLQRQSHQCHGH